MTQPTKEPVTERIIEHVVSTLEGIDRNDSTTAYWHTIRSGAVKRHNGGPLTVNERPCIFVIVDGITVDDDLDSDTHSLNEERLHFALVAHIESRTNVPRDLLRMHRDIRTALMLDPRRTESDGTELAIHTFVENVIVNYSEKLSEPHGSIEVQASVRYRTGTDDLQSAQ